MLAIWFHRGKVCDEAGISPTPTIWSQVAAILILLETSLGKTQLVLHFLMSQFLSGAAVGQEDGRFLSQSYSCPEAKLHLLSWKRSALWLLQTWEKKPVASKVASVIKYMLPKTRGHQNKISVGIPLRQMYLDLVLWLRTSQAKNVPISQPSKTPAVCNLVPFRWIGHPFPGSPVNLGSISWEHFEMLAGWDFRLKVELRVTCRFASLEFRVCVNPSGALCLGLAEARPSENSAIAYLVSNYYDEQL